MMFELGIIVFAFLTVAFHAMSDSADRKEELLSDDAFGRREHYAMLMAVASAICMGVMAVLLADKTDKVWYPIINFVVSYALARFMWFDPFHNIAMGNSIVFVGTKKLYDRMIRRVFKEGGGWSFWFLIRFIIWSGWTAMVLFDPWQWLISK